MTESEHKPPNQPGHHAERAQMVPWLNLRGSIASGKNDAVKLLIAIPGLSKEDADLSHFTITFNPGAPGYDSARQFLATPRVPKGPRDVNGSVYVEGQSLSLELRSGKHFRSTPIISQRGEPLFAVLRQLKMASVTLARSQRLSAASLPARNVPIFRTHGRPVQGGAMDSNRRKH